MSVTRPGTPKGCAPDSVDCSRHGGECWRRLKCRGPIHFHRRLISAGTTICASRRGSAAILRVPVRRSSLLTICLGQPYEHRVDVFRRGNGEVVTD